jgi:heme/copper-type cytochrome/quinol oxidase subunit 1
MTIRDALTRKKRKAIVIAYAGLAVFALGMGIGAGERPWLLVGMVGFVFFCVGTLYLFFFLKCPACGGRIGYTVSYPSGPFSVSRKIRYCPFCGVSLDSEVEEHAV